MRNVVNISLPGELVKAVEQGVKSQHFASKSEFFRYLIRDWMASQLADELKQGEREHKAGKSKKLTSVKSLWK
jgi:Arc/MetJ-type ribon-helix-helix transcriptional regulator